MASKFKPVPRDSVFRIQNEKFVRFIEAKNGEDHCKETKLYPHQRDALIAIKEHFEEKENPNIALVVLPTGCGKTGVAVLAPYVLGSHRVLVVTPSKTISRQILQNFGCRMKEKVEEKEVEEEEVKKKMFVVKAGIVQKNDAGDFLPFGREIDKPGTIPIAEHDELLIVTVYQISGNSSIRIDRERYKYDLVIIDEAHHYPAKTWKTIVDEYREAKRIFLTATPRHKGEYILSRIEKSLVGLPETEEDIYTRVDECYTLDHSNAVEEGIIRNKRFLEIPYRVNKDGKSLEEDANKDVAKAIADCLEDHDKLDPLPDKKPHQALVLAQTVNSLNSATEFCEHYNAVVTNVNYRCEMFVGDSDLSILSDFQSGKIRTLVVVNKLREGYDNNRVSVVAIHRNVARKSRVLFAQFVGRAVRKIHPHDPVTATIIAHQRHNQQYNYDQFDNVADEDIIVGDD